MAEAAVDFDLFVIGGGSGGVRGARIAAGLGARVAICESKALGGTCVNVGCVPKKLLMYGAQYAADVEDAGGYGWQVDAPVLDWSVLLERKNQEINRLNGVYLRLLERAGCTVVTGHATIRGPNTVQVGERQYTAKHILVATGGRPTVPDVPGASLGITSDEVFFLERLPPRIAVVGAGYIGVEFACIFNGFGSDVHMIHRRDSLLNSGFDHDITQCLKEEMTKQGIGLHLGDSVAAVSQTADGALTVSLTSGEALEVDVLLWATGRTPNTASLGLDSVRVQTSSRGAIVVNASYQTDEPSIYACGDVIDRAALTPVALAEGMQIARHLFGGMPATSIDYALIPTAVFSRPNIAMVGLTEQQAREAGVDVVVYRSRFRAMKHTLTGRDEKTLMKLVVDRDSDRVLGCHMCGAAAGEIIQGLAVALKANATKAIFDSTIGIHPTAAEEFVTMRTPAQSTM